MTFNKSMLPSIYHPYCCSCFQTDCLTNNSSNVLGTEFKFNALIWNHQIVSSSHWQVTAVHLNKLKNSTTASVYFTLLHVLSFSEGFPSLIYRNHQSIFATTICSGQNKPVSSILYCLEYNWISNRKKVSQQLQFNRGLR